MLRSLMTAVTGVKAHQTMLDVTGNNIANVNTTGFKKDFTVFQDLLYQTSRGASAPGDVRGGINPIKVGLGVQLAATETNHSSGPITSTGLKTDMAISGEGYFVFRDGSSRLYSRAGNFTMDSENTLVHSGTGYSVQGYAMERDPLNPMNFIKGSELTDIRIPLGAKMEARATTVVGFKCNLDSETKPYLPIGFADIPFTDVNAKTAQISMNGVSYNMGIVTNPSAGTDGADYVTFQFDTVPPTGTTTDLSFNMVGLNNGLPVLSASSTSFLLPDGTTTANVAFNNDSGVLRLTNAANGATLWETNLHSSMSYSSFTIKDKNTGGTPPGLQTYNFIAEFDESDLSSSPVPLTFWWQDPDPALTPPANMKKAVVNIPIKADGSFDLESLDLATATVSGTWPPGYPGTATVPTLKLKSASSGRGIEIQASNDTNTTTPLNPGPLASVGQITQGNIHQAKQSIYDCQGNAYTLEVSYKKLSENRWRWEASFPGNETLFPTPSSGEITFGPCGEIVDPLDAVALDIPFSLLGTQNETVMLDFSGKAFGLNPMEAVTQFASDTTTKAYYQDGYAMGVMKSYSVGADGTIIGEYSNDQKIPLYRIALAQFANPMGLDKVGDTMFSATANSGAPRIDGALSDGSGSIKAGNLEASNVDLTEEFTKLILAQRGFQANTRVVTTSDQILEEVVNMKR